MFKKNISDIFYFELLRKYLLYNTKEIGIVYLILRYFLEMNEKKINKKIDKLFQYSKEKYYLSDIEISYFADKINLNLLCSKQILDEYFIKCNLVCLDAYNICKYQKLSDRFIEFLINKNKINFYMISKYQKLSDEFIIKYKEKLCWMFICKYQKLNNYIMEKCADKLIWNFISENQKLSNNFIKKYDAELNWTLLSKFQSLDENIIDKYNKKVNWKYITKYQNLSTEFIKKYKHKLYWNLLKKKYPINMVKFIYYF